MTLKDAIRALHLAGIENAAHDARVIFCEIGGIPKSELVIGGEVEDTSPAAAAVMRRAERYPLEYLVGSVSFYRERYAVTEECLIPRDDTELLVEFAVKNLKVGDTFIDLCTGSGCVCLSVLNNTKNTTADAVDISEGALGIARKNAESLSLADRVRFHKMDVLEERLPGSYSAVLSNPPYVKESVYDSLSPEIKKEPKIAFVGGADGLTFYRKIIEDYRELLQPSGFFAFEIGYDEGASLVDIGKEYGFSTEIIRDLSGLDRVAVLRRTEKTQTP